MTDPMTKLKFYRAMAAYQTWADKHPALYVLGFAVFGLLMILLPLWIGVLLWFVGVSGVWAINHNWYALIREELMKGKDPLDTRKTL